MFFNKIALQGLNIYNYNKKARKLMNDTDWVNSHYNFLKRAHFQ